MSLNLSGADAAFCLKLRIIALIVDDLIRLVLSTPEKMPSETFPYPLNWPLSDTSAFKASLIF
jgi:hypothetical protein